MSQDSIPKKLPTTTPEVAKMLGINLETYSVHTEPALPVENHGSLENSAHLPVNQDPNSKALEHGSDEKKSTKSALKVMLPYFAVFAVGLFLYYFFFSATDFSSILKNLKTSTENKETALDVLKNQDMTGYYTWARSFYYDVSDPKIIDPDVDNSGNGLSNFEKYLLNLNPKAYDTLGLGMSDSEALAMGINPLTGAALNDKQKDIIAKYIDMEVVMNRLALNHSGQNSNVAGAFVNIRGNNQTNNSTTVNTTNQNQYNPNPFTAISNEIDINMDIPGRLEIPSLNVNAPIIWSDSEKDFNKDLQIGVIHYPGTAVPGQIGTTYISGHSSNYIWAKGDYNYVFTHLDELPDNATFKITVVQKNGKDAIFHYVVKSRKEYKPTEPEQYQNTGKSMVALSTCWPVGSTARRLVVFGELTQVQK